jgi:regulation of enolase protein 1 (concanavalin A-like superfamily)
MKTLNISDWTWINVPERSSISDREIIIHTSPDTDFWRGTYYGLEYDNAPAIVVASQERYWTLKAKVSFSSDTYFDQCGLFIYQDKDNWMKSGIEYQNNGFQQLFSVVTNNGFSDWSMADFDRVTQTMYYRLSRRGSDFLLENSVDGKDFCMMRMFHLFHAEELVQFGFFASSPGDSSFAAHFSEIEWTECCWKAHGAPRF